MSLQTDAGKSVFITGASSGLGCQMAIEFSRRSGLVGISLVAAFRGMSAGGVYGASKTAVTTYLEQTTVPRWPWSLVARRMGVMPTSVIAKPR